MGSTLVDRPTEARGGRASSRADQALRCRIDSPSLFDVRSLRGAASARNGTDETNRTGPLGGSQADPVIIVLLRERGGGWARGLECVVFGWHMARMRVGASRQGSPGEHRAAWNRKRLQDATDCSTDEGLEVEPPYAGW